MNSLHVVLTRLRLEDQRARVAQAEGRHRRPVPGLRLPGSFRPPTAGLAGRIGLANAVYGEPLFLSRKDVNPERKLPPLQSIKRNGPYSSYSELLKTHHDLLSEDFRRTVSEQINDIRANPQLLKSSAHYVVTGDKVLLTQKYGRRGRHQIGIRMSFDPNKYQHVQWDEDKRFLVGNLVFLSQNGMKTFEVGVVHDNNPHQLRKGRVVIKIVSGTDGKYFKMLDQDMFLGRTFFLVESAAFYFPYLHVTNALRESRYQSSFTEEIVKGQASIPPKYLSHLSSQQKNQLDLLRNSINECLNESQANALKSVLEHRVALVQGPPGTGKTFLGCKIAELFVRLKRNQPLLFSGPILVVTTTNHAIHEFLSRCLVFTDQIIHGYSDKHERSQYGALQQEYDKAVSHEKDALMQKADLLAMTTTRAAYMRSTLDKLGIKIVIVEEAAEALEGYVLASLPNHIQHLVQIGDHKQLQPSCKNFMLGASFNLDLSLFERLVNNGLECPMLNEQRRMRPSIMKLVRNIYPNLTNHPSTKGRPSVNGVDVPVFFINKTQPETQEGTGYCNADEAEMAAELGAYLLHRGYDAQKITILTTYRRQLSLVLKHLRRIGDGASDVRATCVDNFQGEENDIIILSLVRSNSSGDIGFLKKENRACVALSRAKIGFFMLGNMTCLTASGSSSWQHVKDVLSGSKRMGPALPLACPHGRKFRALGAADVREAKEGCAVCRLISALVEAESFSKIVASELEDPKEVQSFVGRKRLRRELAARELAVECLRMKCNKAEEMLKMGEIDVATETLQSLENKLEKWVVKMVEKKLIDKKALELTDLLRGLTLFKEG